MLKRHITDNLLEALSDTPVVTLHGARQTGKSTLVQGLARDEYPAQYFTLDDLSVLSAVRQDPAGFLSGVSGPMVIDEAQRAPDLLLAVKSEVDRERSPGRFLLTGSAHILSLPRLSDALAGRMETLTLWPLSQGEIEGRREGFIDYMFSKKPLSLRNMGREDRKELIGRMLAGGYPEVLTRAKPARRRAWFESYLNSILQRDVRDLANITGLAELPRLLQVLASRAGGLLNFANLARDSGLNQVTLKRYFTLLEGIFIVRTVQPWFTNRIKRLVKSPKLYLGDTGLLAYLRDVTPERMERDPNSAGTLLENFVALELIKQITWSGVRPRIYHFRDYLGNEINFILEAPGGRKYLGIEVKASAAARADDFKGLKALSDTLGKEFHRGVVLYTGQKAVPFGKNLHALPVNSLWKLGAE
jgi:predicted AAA+ superfamily ATPase